MALDLVRAGMMAVFAAIDGVTVPEPTPSQIDDRTILVIPSSGGAVAAAHRGKNGGIVYAARDVFQVEYHRLVPESEIGSVIDDICVMAHAIRDAVFREFVPGGGKFGETTTLLHGVNLLRVGGLGWHEWTAGCALSVDVTHHTVVT